MHGSKYNSQKYNKHGDGGNTFLRISLSIIFAIAASFLLIFIGQRLGEAVPPADVTTSGGEVTENPNDGFHFVYKSIPPIRLGNDYSFKNEGCGTLDKIYFDISDNEGKLLFSVHLNDIIYGGGVTSTLKELSDALETAGKYSESISIGFTPFKDEKNPESARALSVALIEMLANEGVSEVVLIPNENSFDDLKSIKEALGDSMQIGVLLESELLESEITVREYYSAFDFISVDLRGYEISENAVKPDGAGADTDSGSEADTNPKTPTVREFFKQYGLILKKYSMRIRTDCVASGEAAEFVRLCKEFAIGSYEIITK